MVSAAPEVHESLQIHSTASFEAQYVSGVNPHWVRLLKLLRMFAWEALGAPASSQTTLKMLFSGNQENISL